MANTEQQAPVLLTGPKSNPEHTCSWKIDSTYGKIVGHPNAGVQHRKAGMQKVLLGDVCTASVIRGMSTGPWRASPAVHPFSISSPARMLAQVIQNATAAGRCAHN